MFVSIVIAVQQWQKNLEECIQHCRRITYPEFELIILPDQPLTGVELSEGPVPINVVPTGPISPADKRDRAVACAKGEVLAFLDDDAYPAGDWLTQAVRHFVDPDVAAVGGPAVTPPSDTLRQQASGAVYASPLVSGQYFYRYVQAREKQVDDYPSCNFFVRRSVMQELGGFNTTFWPGEDTKLCHDIVTRLKKKIIYDPQVLVWHHRRTLFIPHLRQVANYAVHRGYFTKRYPHTSCKPAYFLPTFLALGLSGAGISALWVREMRGPYLCGVAGYLILVLIFSARQPLVRLPLVFAGIIVTHLTYGFYFLKGMLSRRLEEEG